MRARLSKAARRREGQTLTVHRTLRFQGPGAFEEMLGRFQS